MLNELKTFLQNKKNLSTVIVLTLMVAILPLGIYLAQIQQLFFSRASGTLIQLGEGSCVTTNASGEKALKCKTVPLVLYNPFREEEPPPPSTLDEGVAAYFSFDEDGNPKEFLTQISAQANGTQSVDGRIGKARKFDIGNDIEYFNSATFDSPVQTISAWVKPEQSTYEKGQFPSIVNRRNDQNVGQFFEFTGYYPDPHNRDQHEGQMQCGWSNFIDENGQKSGVGVDSGDIKVEPGVWTHVLCMYDGEKATLYFNGTKVSETTKKGRIFNNADWERGQEKLIIGRNRFDPNQTFNGSIDEVVIWNRSLTEEEIIALAEGVSVNPLEPVISQDLLSYWKLNEPTATSSARPIADSLNNNNATGTKVTPVPGVSDNAQQFEASSSSDITAPNSFNLNTPQFTVAGWVKPTSKLIEDLNAKRVGFPSIINRRDTINTNGFTLEFTTYDGESFVDDFRREGQIQCQILGSAGLVSTVDKAQTDKWNHVACTFDGKVASLYINGLLSQTQLAAQGFTNPANSALVFGKNLISGSHLDAGLDEFALWKRALTGTEIALLARNKLPDSSELTPQTPPSPPVSAICSPRPVLGHDVVMTTQGQRVRITPGVNVSTQQNKLKQIEFTRIENGVVKIGAETMTVDKHQLNSSNLEFIINQIQPGIGTTVEYKITDQCGEVSKFAGGGVDSGWPSPTGGSPAPTVTATATPSVTATPNPTPVACQPAPNNIKDSDVQIPGGRRITRTAGTNSNTPNNKFYTLKLTGFTDVRVDAYGKTYTSPSGAITIDVTQMTGPGTTNIGPQPVDTVSFDIYPMTPGGAATLQFEITDSCRDWSEFVGTGAAGAANYWGAGSPPPPINTNEGAPISQRNEKVNAIGELASMTQSKAQGAILGLQSRIIPEASAQTGSQVSLYRLRKTDTQLTILVKQSEIASYTSQGWTNEGTVLTGFSDTSAYPSSAKVIYRLKKNNSEEELLTPNLSEVNSLISNGWTNHGVYFYAFEVATNQPAWTEITGTDENGNPTGFVDHPAITVPSGLLPVYRLQKNISQEKYLTTQQSEVTSLTSQGWTNRGILFYALPAIATVTPTPVATASPITSASPTASASAIATASATASASAEPLQCTEGTYESVEIDEGSNCGTLSATIPVGASSGTINYTAPNVSYSEVVCNITVTTQNNGGCTINTGGKGTNANPLRPGETIQLTYADQCTSPALLDFANGSVSSPNNGCSMPLVVRPEGAEEPTETGFSYKLAESESALSTAEEKPFDGDADSFNATFVLANQEAGIKQIWVEFKDLETGEIVKDFINAEMLSEDPVITGVNCSTPLGDGALIVDISGKNLGQNISQAAISVNGTAIQKNTWEKEYLKGTWQSPTPPALDGRTFDIEVSLADGRKLPQVQCTIGASMVSLGTRLFCRGDGSYAVKGAKVMLIDEEGNKVEEMVDIAHNGMISGLKSVLSDGKNYVISIKAPKLIRRNITFTALRGTTVLTNQEGKPIVLPIGDISPRPDGDGVINTLDRSLLVNQWRAAVDATQPISADFNVDNRVNSFDWACMRREWNARDDGIPDRAPRSTPTGGVVSASPAPVCGTIAGISCPVGYRCQLSGTGNDQGGVCISVSQFGCTTNAECGNGKECVRYQSYPGNCQPSGNLCAQVITRACSNTSSECVNFPTPCHVPPGWTVQPQTSASPGVTASPIATASPVSTASASPSTSATATVTLSPTSIARGGNITVSWNYQSGTPLANDLFETVQPMANGTEVHAQYIYLNNCGASPATTAPPTSGQCPLSTTNYGPTTYKVKLLRNGPSGQVMSTTQYTVN